MNRRDFKDPIQYKSEADETTRPRSLSISRAVDRYRSSAINHEFIGKGVESEAWKVSSQRSQRVLNGLKSRPQFLHFLEVDTENNVIEVFQMTGDEWQTYIKTAETFPWGDYRVTNE